MTFTIGGSMAHDRVNHAAAVTVTGGGAITLGNKYELGIARVKVIPGVSSDTFYAHNDHLGTLRAESDRTAAFNTYPVHTAFGENMTNLGQRHSYAGAFGYQSNPNFTALHVGARYYDPASGRFLQRDPIGIRGGRNVYAYVSSRPTSLVDPTGRGVSESQANRAGCWLANEMGCSVCLERRTPPGHYLSKEQEQAVDDWVEDNIKDPIRDTWDVYVADPVDAAVDAFFDFFDWADNPMG